MVAAGTLLAIVTLVLAINYSTRFVVEPVQLSGTGRVHNEFRVFYIENTLFPENPIEQSLHFLRAMTDYIEVDSGMSLHFDLPSDTVYSYRALMRLVVSASDTEIVYIVEKQLSEAEGQAFGTRLNFGPDTGPGEPGGTYVIRLPEYVALYNNFLEEYTLISGLELSAVERFFNVQLSIEFTYAISSPAMGIDSVSTTGFNIPIASSVFTLTPFGDGSVSGSVMIQPPAPDIQAHFLILYALGFIAAGVLLFFGIRRGVIIENPEREHVESILKKYASEIVMSKSKLEFQHYEIFNVVEFDELAKLSMNFNKHIMCYDSNDQVEFGCIVDNIAFCYTFKIGAPDKKIEQAVPEEKIKVVSSREKVDDKVLARLEALGVSIEDTE